MDNGSSSGKHSCVASEQDARRRHWRGRRPRENSDYAALSRNIPRATDTTAFRFLLSENPFRRSLRTLEPLEGMSSRSGLRSREQNVTRHVLLTLAPRSETRRHRAFQVVEQARSFL